MLRITQNRQMVLFFIVIPESGCKKKIIELLIKPPSPKKQKKQKKKKKKRKKRKRKEN